MIRFARRDQIFAITLSGLAGYVDAIGFLKAGGFFVSFMSGNSTRLAVGLVRGAPSPAVAATLIGAFLIGVMLGTWTSERFGQKPRAVLLLVAGLLSAAEFGGLAGYDALSVCAAAAAMGAENAIFAKDGDVQIGLTYMTGTLVKFAQRFAYRLMGHRKTGWLPFGLLWLGLLTGAVLGALVYDQIGFAGLWPAAGAAIVLAFASPRFVSSSRSEDRV